MQAGDVSEPSDTTVAAAPHPPSPSPPPDHPRRLAAAAEVAAIALSIAVCAAAPEFIWQGLGRFFGHATWLNLCSALLIALVFVSFVEPIIERLRDLLTGANKPHAGSYGPAFTLSLGLAFGLVSVCLHESIAAFVAHDGLEGSDLREAIQVAVSWAWVPFLVALAWQNAGSRRLAIPTGIAAALSPALAGWAFGWGAGSIATTTIPCLVILLAGYRALAAAQGGPVFVRLAGITAAAAAAWLALAAIADGVLAASGRGQISFYATSDLLVDLRFYLGWALGLFLASSHERHGAAATDKRQDAPHR